MKKVPVLNTEGAKVGEAELSDYYFGCEVNQPAMHQVVRMQLALSRAGTASTRSRGELRGGGAKPWRQKGTGRARAGSNRSPIWRGGGTVFGPTPRDYGFKVNRKVRRLALRSALSARAGEDAVTVLEDFELEAPSTKTAAELLKTLGIEESMLLVLAEYDENLEKSFRNIPGAGALTLSNLNTYDILASDRIVFTKSALDGLQEPASKGVTDEASA
jgi:large subunit ribosomal protein L4